MSLRFDVNTLYYVVKGSQFYFYSQKQQSMFRINNKRNRYAPANPSFSRCNSNVDINMSCLNAVLLFLMKELYMESIRIKEE